MCQTANKAFLVRLGDVKVLTAIISKYMVEQILPGKAESSTA
jgi:hypothetical protein